MVIEVTVIGESSLIALCIPVFRNGLLRVDVICEGLLQSCVLAVDIPKEVNFAIFQGRCDRVRKGRELLVLPLPATVACRLVTGPVVGCHHGRHSEVLASGLHN